MMNIIYDKYNIYVLYCHDFEVLSLNTKSCPSQSTRLEQFFEWQIRCVTGYKFSRDFRVK